MRCKLAYRLETDDFVMAIFADAPDGERIAYSVEKHRIPLGGVMPVIEFPRMRELLQSIVDEAAKVGIVPGDSASTLRAKDENLGDLRQIVAALLKPTIAVRSADAD